MLGIFEIGLRTDLVCQSSTQSTAAPTSTTAALTSSYARASATSSPASASIAEATSSTPYHGATLAAIIVGPVSLVAILAVIVTFFVAWRRRNTRQLETVERRKIGYPRSYGSMSEPGERSGLTSNNAPASRYANTSAWAASVADTSEYAPSSHPEYDSLSAPPPTRSPFRATYSNASQGAGALTDASELDTPLALGPPVELAAHYPLSPVGPPRSPTSQPVYFQAPPAVQNGNESWAQAGDVAPSRSRSFRRPMSLISRWRI